MKPEIVRLRQEIARDRGALGELSRELRRRIDEGGQLTDDVFAGYVAVTLISGRCLEMQAYGFYVPSAGRVVWSADYFHSGYTWIH